MQDTNTEPELVGFTERQRRLILFAVHEKWDINWSSGEHKIASEYREILDAIEVEKDE